MPFESPDRRKIDMFARGAVRSTVRAHSLETATSLAPASEVFPRYSTHSAGTSLGSRPIRRALSRRMKLPNPPARKICRNSSGRSPLRLRRMSTPARIAPEANCNSRKSRWVTQTGRSIPDSSAEARTNAPSTSRSRNAAGTVEGSSSGLRSLPSGVNTPCRRRWAARSIRADPHSPIGAVSWMTWISRSPS